MAPRDTWPPLEDVREWAKVRLDDGRVPSSDTAKYKNLIALISEILDSGKNAENVPLPEAQGHERR